MILNLIIFEVSGDLVCTTFSSRSKVHGGGSHIVEQEPACKEPKWEKNNNIYTQRKRKESAHMLFIMHERTIVSVNSREWMGAKKIREKKTHQRWSWCWKEQLVLLWARPRYQVSRPSLIEGWIEKKKLSVERCRQTKEGLHRRREKASSPITAFLTFSGDKGMTLELS